VARPRGFDESEALDRAMRTFWAKGYEATSLDDLCAATGLGRSSLYATFGDKRALFLRALDHYERASAARVEAALERPGPLRASVAAFVATLIDEIVAGPGRRGCFIGNTAAELARSDRVAATRVQRSLAHRERAFHKAIERAVERGELPRATDARALARFLTSGIQGLRLVGKANPDRAVLADIASVMLRCLDASPTKRDQATAPRLRSAAMSSVA
jgi:TetR/AcrR family transcriptional regulator, transcriptional repressor for nem operon